MRPSPGKLQELGLGEGLCLCDIELEPLWSHLVISHLFSRWGCVVFGQHEGKELSTWTVPTVCSKVSRRLCLSGAVRCAFREECLEEPCFHAP